MTARGAAMRTVAPEAACSASDDERAEFVAGPGIAGDVEAVGRDSDGSWWR